MPNPEINERLYTGARDFCNANFAGYLSAIDTKLTAPEFELGYSSVFGRTRYPAAVLVQGPGGQEPAATLASQIDTELTCAIAIKESRPDKLQTNMLRYTDAMYDMLREDATLGGLCDEAIITELIPYQGDPEDKAIAVLVFTISLSVELPN